MPELCNTGHMIDLHDELRHRGVKLLIIDPLYLSLLAGEKAVGMEAGNLYHMGPLLRSVAQTCLKADCTPLLAHHTKKNLSEPFEPLDLEDLAYGGGSRVCAAMGTSGSPGGIRAGFGPPCPVDGGGRFGGA